MTTSGRWSIARLGNRGDHVLIQQHVAHRETHSLFDYSRQLVVSRDNDSIYCVLDNGIAR